VSDPVPTTDFFEDALSRFHPSRILADPRANGEGVSVCVIDSGVERALLEERFHERGQDIKPIDGGVFVLPKDGAGERAEPLPYDGHQSTPHGTTVADILLTVAPRIKLYSADVFGAQGSCEVDTVIWALRWAVDHWHCKIINLSLGVAEHRLQQLQKRYQFLRAIEDAYFKDVLVFAAAHNEHPLTLSYPSAFAPPLVSVDKHLFSDPLHFAYQLREQVEFQAHGRGYLGPFAAEPATSWAAPHLAGIAARVLSLRPGLKPFEIKTILYWMFQAASRRP
jgi:subtilisin